MHALLNKIKEDKASDRNLNYQKIFMIEVLVWSYYCCCCYRVDYYYYLVLVLLFNLKTIIFHIVILSMSISKKFEERKATRKTSVRCWWPFVQNLFNIYLC